MNRLIDSVPSYAPGISAATVVATGATELRRVFSTDQIPGVIRAYMAGLQAALAIPIGTSGIAFLVSLLHFWGAKKPMIGEKPANKESSVVA